MTATATPPTVPAPKPARKTPIWAKILLVFVILAVIAGAALVSFNVGKILGATESRDTQVIRSIKGEEQVILVTAGMTDVQEEREDGLDFAIGDWDLFTLPGSERSVLVRYEYDANGNIETVARHDGDGHLYDAMNYGYHTDAYGRRRPDRPTIGTAVVQRRAPAIRMTSHTGTTMTAPHTR